MKTSSELSVAAPRPGRVPGRSGVSVARALGSSTRAAIYQHLRQFGTSRTVREVAAAFQLHPNVARTHLELLAQAGLVVVGSVKRPGGGRPAKVYLAREEIDVEQGALDAAGQPSGGAGAALVVRLLVTVLNQGGERAKPGVPTGVPTTSGSTLILQAYEVAAAEGRRLVQGVRGDAPAGQGARGDAPAGQGVRRSVQAEIDRPLEAAARTAIRALRSHAPDARVVRAGRDWVELAGVCDAVELVERVDAPLAEAFERGLVAGAFAGSGVQVNLAEAGSVPGGPRAWRAQVAALTGARADIVPAGTVDTRGQQRETGVVHAMRAVTGLGAGEVLEVLAEGAGSPAAFARWADRAGHQLLGVERATDLSGRPAIRLLIRKGS
ncbi:MAG: helix-turn-helix domain-containing protein [Egibacteraceae bacterium]